MGKVRASERGLEQASKDGQENEEGRHCRKVRNPLWFLLASAGEEDGDLSACHVHLHVLRKELDEEERRWHLEVQNLQEGLRRRCLLRAYWRCHDGQEHHQASARDHGSLSRTLGRKNHGQTI